MNTNQKWVVAIGATAVLGMLFFPPFHFVRAAGTVNAGYSFLFSPPGNATVDFATLALQWIGTLIVVAAAYFVVPPPSQIGPVTNAPDEKPRTTKRIASWFIWPVAAIVLLFAYMVILGIGKEAGRLGKKVSQAVPSTQSPSSAKVSDTEQAARYGISVQEYQLRDARVKVLCWKGNFLDLNCAEAVLYGISVEEYQQRNARTNVLCLKDGIRDLTCDNDVLVGRR